MIRLSIPFASSACSYLSISRSLSLVLRCIYIYKSILNYTLASLNASSRDVGDDGGTRAVPFLSLSFPLSLSSSLSAIRRRIALIVRWMDERQRGVQDQDKEREERTMDFQSSTKISYSLPLINIGRFFLCEIDGDGGEGLRQPVRPIKELLNDNSFQLDPIINKNIL